MFHRKFPCSHSHTSKIECEEGVIYKHTKFLTAAIYIDKTMRMIDSGCMPFQKMPIYFKTMKTKRCSCYIDRFPCPCHSSLASEDGIAYTNEITNEREDFWVEKGNSPKVKSHAEVPRLRIPPEPLIKNGIKPKRCNKKKNVTLKFDTIEEYTPKAVPSETKIGSTVSLPPFPTTNTRERVETLSTTCLDQKNQIIHTSTSNCGEEEQDTDDSRSSGSSTLSAASQITIKKSEKTVKNDLKLSLSSLTSFTPDQNESVRNWLSKKDEDAKKKQLEKQIEDRRKELEKQKISQRERENFNIWLNKKKKMEDKKREEVEREHQLEQLRELENQKKHLEEQIKYHDWLKRKEEKETNKKNQGLLKAMQDRIDNERRAIENGKAFQKWLDSSKNKPKPIPFNRGLDSLKSSLSLAYVNPIPWVPNIEPKSSSQ